MTVADADPVTWASWTLDPAVVWCAAAAVVHEQGRRRRRRRRGSSAEPSTGRQVAFWAGLGVVVVALASPVDPLADQLFAVHMTQHLLLGLVAPLLLVAARPARTMTWVLSRPTRQLVVRTVHRWGTRTGLGHAAPLTALLAVGAHVLTLALWHLPVAYDLAVRNRPVHLVEHASLFLGGLALWWVVLGVRWQQRSALAILYLFVAGLPMGGLAALLTLAPHPLYTSHLATTGRWGLTPLEDQQLAGAIMWVPGGTVYLAVAAVLVVRWLGAGPAPGERRLQWEG